MASNGGDEKLVSGKDVVNCSETTVEIKIKTLDSQTYTMRVDKCVPVPALKEQIALVTGVLSEQQRLICRGKVLKDDQLLSAYHVEDGHTLHLVVRQPVATSSENPPNLDSDPASTSGRSPGSGGPGILVGSFNVSEQDGPVGVGRIVSALLSSLAMANSGSGSEGINLNELPSERLPNIATLQNLSRQRPELSAFGQSNFGSGALSSAVADPVESLQAPVIPDSLATLLQNLSRLRQDFTANVEALRNSIEAAWVCGIGGQNSDASSPSPVQRGLPMPASLAEILLTTGQVLNEQVAECLLLLAIQLEGHTNVVDASERVRIQNNALRSGALFHNLGALLLELARTTITLRMGHSPADAIVNAGPAVFISSAGPNPIMVQPLSFQPGIGFGPSGGIYQPSSGVSAGSGGSGVLRRNIDIRIQTVAVPSAASRRDSTRSQNVGQTDPGASSNGNSARDAAARGSGGSASGDSEMHLFPIRTVLTAVPAHGGHTTTESSRGTMGILFPLVSRVQRVATGGSGHSRAAAAAQASDELHGPGVEAGSQSIPDIGVELQNLGTLGVDGSSTGSHSEQTDNPGMHAQLHSRIEQLLRSILPGEQDQADSGNPPRGTEANSGTQNENSEAEASAAAAASDEGAFLSSVLQQLMPLILERGRSTGLNDSSSAVNMEEDMNGRESMQAAQGSGDGGGSPTRRPDDPSLQPETKRQKRE